MASRSGGTSPSWELGGEHLDAAHAVHAEDPPNLGGVREAQQVPAPVADDDGPTLSDGDPRTLRRVLMNLVTEYSRHAGHADVFRAAVDGLVGEDPPQN